MSTVVFSEHKFAPIAATKVRRILPLVRGRTVQESLDLLRTVSNRGAAFVQAVIQTAAANASESRVRNVASLRIVEAVANDGPAQKRIRAKSRGMAFVERHRKCHIRVALSVPE